MKRKRSKGRLVLISVLSSLIACAAHGDFIYVDDSVAQSGDGSTWQQAKKTIQEAVAIAVSDQDIIRVAQGTY